MQRGAEAADTARDWAHRHEGLVRVDAVLVRLGHLRGAVARARRPTRVKRRLITLSDACHDTAGRMWVNGECGAHERSMGKEFMAVAARGRRA